MSEALREIFGENEARVLEEQLAPRAAVAFQMPRAQALLLTLRDTLPRMADAVLARSRKLYDDSRAD